MKNTAGPVSHILQYMNYLQKGMAVHTDNLNRADLTGAKANELSPFSEEVSKGKAPTLRATNEKHITLRNSGLIHDGSTFASVAIRSSQDLIDREEELQKVNDLSTEFLKATRLYQKSIGLFKTILNYRG